MKLNNFEKNTIIIILFMTWIGGAVLVHFEFPPIISSIFFATGIATVVYHFLGGLKGTTFMVGAAKLTGSLGSLLACAWFINSQLKAQTETGEANMNSKYELFDSKKKLLGTLPIGTYTLGMNKDFEVKFNDSIKLGELKFDTLKLSKNFEIKALDDINLGKLSNTNFKEIGMYNDFDMSVYTEIKYKLRLQAPYDSKLDSDYWYKEKSPDLDFKNKYFGLPFEIKPVYKENVEKTEIRIKNGTTSHTLLARGKPYKLFLSDKTPSLYLIRVATLVKTKGIDSYDNFVVYQIFGFSRMISEFESLKY